MQSAYTGPQLQAHMKDYLDMLDNVRITKYQISHLKEIKSYYASIKSPGEKAMVCIGHDWWIQCLPIEAIQVLERKENYMIKDLEEVDKSLALLKERQLAIKTALDPGNEDTDKEEKGKVLDIVEDLTPDDINLLEISNKLGQIKLEDDGKKARTSHADSRALASRAVQADLSKKDSKEKELSDLEGIFSKFEQEEKLNQELEACKDSETATGAIQSMKNELKRCHSPTVPIENSEIKTVQFKDQDVDISNSDVDLSYENGEASGDFDSEASTDGSENYDDLIKEVENDDETEHGIYTQEDSDLSLSQEALMSEVVREYERIKSENSIIKAPYSRVREAIVKEPDEEQAQDSRDRPMSRFKSQRYELHKDSR